MTPPLEPPDTFCLQAAQGWLKLGNPVEAEAELDNIRAQFQRHPAVLEVRWEVYAAGRRWDACAEIGQELVDLQPGEPLGWINRSYALRRAPGGGLPAAYDSLRPAAERVKDASLITFNLACYACQLGRIEEGRQWLAQSFALAKRHGRLRQQKQLALAEPDLEPLWKEIASL
jgi:predicted Zn-dependent protease